MSASSLEHLGLWTADLERLRAWYERWLGAVAGERYENRETGFSSYFLSFAGGARLELMQRAGEELGLRAHVAFAVGDVDALVEQLRAAGVPVLGEPRATGDGYYEAVVADPDGNRVELMH